MDVPGNPTSHDSAGGGNPLQPDGGAPRPFGSRTRVGAAAAARAVAEDASALVRAEIELAKAEVMQSVKVKAAGSGLLVGAAVCGWLAIQGLLLTAGLALALVLPGWAAALVVSG
ncbi:MAG: phage holin family protein, partial [Actinomycetota bacterium]|nr:phage holin family protein [Actinomycetota bacterium]